MLMQSVVARLRRLSTNPFHISFRVTVKPDSGADIAYTRVEIGAPATLPSLPLAFIIKKTIFNLRKELIDKPIIEIQKVTQQAHPSRVIRSQYSASTPTPI